MEQINSLLAKYAAGQLSAAEQLELEKYIAEGKVQVEQLENFEAVDKYLDLADAISPSREMDAGFQAMLEREQSAGVKKPAFNFLSWLGSPWRLAIPIAIALFAFWLGRGTTPDNPGLPVAVAEKDMAASLLSAADISEKIHLVSSTVIEDSTDRKVIDVLLFTLNNDESNNVRLACIDVLMNYSRLPAVREGLVNAISNQSSPIVLGNLADAIASSGNNLEKEEFESRINKDLPPPIKKSMEEVLLHL